MWQDLRYAFRTLAKSPGFAGVAVLAIALGVGPNSAVFSIINAVLLRPLPFRDSERVVMLWETMKSRGFDQLPVSGPTFLDWKRDARSFENMVPAFALPEYGFNLTGGGEPERVRGGMAGAAFVDVMGITPSVGRGFLPDEDRPGAPKVVLIGYSLWQRRFGSDPRIIGRSVGLDGTAYTVIGVLPGELSAVGNVDVWVPIGRDIAQDNRANHNFGIIARLKPGVTTAQAQAEMNGIAQRLAKVYPATNRGIGVLVISFHDLLSNVARPAFMVLFAAVGFLLLIACANVASLLLARSAARQREIAIRTALGAGRGHIVRQLLAESLVLSLAGGLLGLLLAGWSIRSLRNALPDVVPLLKNMNMDARVLAFTLAASVLTGILFGLLPALRAARTDLHHTLKEGGGGKGTLEGSSQRTRSALLMAEVALAVVLLIGAGLMMRSFVHITSMNPGFRAENVLTMQLSLPEKKYATDRNRVDFQVNVLRRVEALPGVRAAGTINILPMRSYFLNLPVNVVPYHVDGLAAPLKGQEPQADYRRITPGFFAALGIPFRRGRNFTMHDNSDVPPVAIVNEALARQCCAGEDPIGKRVRLGGPAGQPREIVGVAADALLQGLESRVRPAVYLPSYQSSDRYFSLLVRTASDPAGMSAAVRHEILAVDSEQPVSEVRTMERVVSDSLLLRRLSMSLLGVFASLALLLAGVGIYGLTSYSVSRRTHEIGLRVALGAERDNILRLLVGRGLLVGLAGVAIGLPVAFAVTRLMQGLLFGVTSADPVVFLCVPALLLAIAAVACYIPARKAMRVDPVVALRYE